jgi:hypothetical protein
MMRRLPGFESPEDSPPAKRTDNPPPPAAPDDSLATQIATLIETVGALEKHVGWLSREQLRSNALVESALAESREAMAVVRSAIGRPAPIERMLTPLRPPEQNTKVLEALMPVLDSIEAGLSSGKAQLDYLEDAAAREILAGWLEGQRLLRERLLTLLERENVRPIPTLGEHFDPFWHVAVESIYDATRPVGTIVEERMRGYLLDKRVLRFAEVVVTRDMAG